MKPTIDSFNRLSLGIMEKEGCQPEDALRKLQSLTLNILCGEAIRDSLPLQAALLTTINTAKRAFLGGVSVQMPPHVACLLPWPQKRSLDEIVCELGGSLTTVLPTKDFTLTFGLAAQIDDNQLQIVCSDWQGGVMANGEPSPFDADGTIPTAGVFAGGLGTTLAFLRLSGMEIAAGDESVGLSLWRPDLHWLDPLAKGPAVALLPQKYWLLGLGHLGQAYLWNIGLLPYSDPQEVSILLQDPERIVKANWSAGLLTTKKAAGHYKTRWCSLWLEKRQFNTVITERRFDEHTRRACEEPFVALCGFDTASSRLHLEAAGFDLIVEAGLGGNLATFDRATLHTFPDARQTPQAIWDATGEAEINPVVLSILQKQLKDPCGIVPLTIAGKAVSASFVGACTGALALGELLRGLHGGIRFDKISLQLRDLNSIRAIGHEKNTYTTEQARNGFLTVRSAVPAPSF
ncbi:MAG TPA: hypothetical protein VGS79_13075 [Puia sp.]|nr:hypothetical protein [Puia sp.]